MKILTPVYYDSFRCIAGDCKHSCCIGWEIDIDENTYQIYQDIKGPFGNRLREKISAEETPHFILGEGERCPFLNENNLCDIILELGEDAICQICTDHPRFRNFYTNCTEVGLGLCCEEAGRLLLSETVPFAVAKPKDSLLTEEEKAFFSFRNTVFSLVQDRRFSLQERIRKLLQTYGLSFPRKSNREWVGIFLSLEQLEEKWGEMLTQFSHTTELLPLPKDWEIPLEQLLCYFLYRHLSGGLEDGNFEGRILFSILSVFIISSLFQMTTADGFRMENLIEISRLYSSEIEYSAENTETLFEIR